MLLTEARIRLWWDTWKHKRKKKFQQEVSPSHVWISGLISFHLSLAGVSHVVTRKHIRSGRVKVVVPICSECGDSLAGCPRVPTPAGHGVLVSGPGDGAPGPQSHGPPSITSSPCPAQCRVGAWRAASWRRKWAASWWRFRDKMQACPLAASEQHCCY